jgi:hypothetical protein
MLPVTVNEPLTCILEAVADASVELFVAVNEVAEMPDANVTSELKTTPPENVDVPVELKLPLAVSVPANDELAAASFWTSSRHVILCAVDRFPEKLPVDVKTQAPETFKVPATTVLPVAAATVNLLVAMARFPATFNADESVAIPVTFNVDRNVTAPVAPSVPVE